MELVSVGWVERIVRIEEVGNEYRMFIRNPERKAKVSITVDVKYRLRDGVDWLLVIEVWGLRQAVIRVCKRTCVYM